VKATTNTSFKRREIPRKVKAAAVAAMMICIFAVIAQLAMLLVALGLVGIDKDAFTYVGLTFGLSATATMIGAGLVLLGKRFGELFLIGGASVQVVMGMKSLTESWPPSLSDFGLVLLSLVLTLSFALAIVARDLIPIPQSSSRP
jgi:hypothetical protein